MRHDARNVYLRVLARMVSAFVHASEALNEVTRAVLLALAAFLLGLGAYIADHERRFGKAPRRRNGRQRGDDAGERTTASGEPVAAVASAGPLYVSELPQLVDRVMSTGRRHR